MTASPAAGPSGASSPRRSAAAVGPHRWPVARAAGRRGPADRAAQGGRPGDLAAGLRRMRQGPAHHAAPRPGLVLRRLRPSPPALRRLRQDAQGGFARPGRAATVRAMPARWRPGPGRDRGERRGSRRSRAAGRARDRRGDDGGCPGRAARQLAWALQDQPGLLTGAGALAPVPSVLRLIGELCDAGASGIVRPPCPRCGRVISLHRRIGGQWSCRNCVARSRFQPCARCGAVQQVAIRDEHGGPLCPHCLITDPANQETCAGCGRRRPVSVRSADGPLCPACAPVKTMTCSICGCQAACYVSKTTGEPWCEACKQRWARCSRCGEAGQVRGGTRTEPLCAACTRPDPGFWRTCPGCGQTGRISAGRCARCTIGRRSRELLGSETGDIRPGLQALYHALATAERPATIEAWLNRSGAPAILRELAGKKLSHRALDELPQGKPAEHLRSVLVAIGTLPARDEQMSRLERWTARSSPSAPTLASSSWRTATPSGTSSAGCARGSAASTPPTTRSWPPSGSSKPPSPCSTGSPHTTSPWPPPARRPGDMAGHRAGQPPHRRGELRPLGPKAQADQPGFRGHPVGRPDRRHRHRDSLGTGTPAAARRHAQARRPRRRAARPALRPMASHDQPAHPQPRPGQRRPGAHPARPRASRPSRAA